MFDIFADLSCVIRTPSLFQKKNVWARYINSLLINQYILLSPLCQICGEPNFSSIFL